MLPCAGSVLLCLRQRSWNGKTSKLSHTLITPQPLPSLVAEAHMPWPGCFVCGRHRDHTTCHFKWMGLLCKPSTSMCKCSDPRTTTFKWLKQAMRRQHNSSLLPFKCSLKSNTKVDCPSESKAHVNNPFVHWRAAKSEWHVNMLTFTALTFPLPQCSRRVCLALKLCVAAVFWSKIQLE